MDNGKGAFEVLEAKEVNDLDEPTKKNLFTKGEILEIKASRFRVHDIKKNKLILKLLNSK